MAPPKTKIPKIELTQERLRSLLHYDPASGVFRWKVSKRRKLTGLIAGYHDPHGYIWIGVDGVVYLAHRLAWMWMNGYMPPEVDHEDMVKSNNKWANLRSATHSQNGANKIANSNSMTGLRGVTIVKENVNRPYVAYVGIKGKVKYLGCFSTPEEAHRCYLIAAQKVHGKFARKS